MLRGRSRPAPRERDGRRGRSPPVRVDAPGRSSCCCQAARFVRVAFREGDGGFAADDERAQEVALRRVGLAGAHLFQLGGDATKAESQHLRVVRDQVTGYGAAVADAGVVERPRLRPPASDAPLPGARLLSRVRLREGGVEVGTDDKLTVQDLHRQVALDDLAEEQRATDDQRLTPEARPAERRARRPPAGCR